RNGTARFRATTRSPRRPPGPMAQAAPDPRRQIEWTARWNAWNPSPYRPSRTLPLNNVSLLAPFEIAEYSHTLGRQRRLQGQWLTRHRMRNIELAGVQKHAAQ